MGAELLLLAVGAAVAGFVQGVSGFAFGMVAMSFWVWAIEPRVAAVLTVFGGLCGQLLSAATVRRKLSLATFAPYLAGGLLGIPMGVWLLPRLDPAVFKLAMGSMLLVFCPAMLLSSRIPRITAGGRVADGLVGMTGGLMGGMGGFPGVVPSLWVTLRGYERDLQRSVIQNFNLAALSVTMLGYVLTGAVDASMWPRFAVVLPALVLPSLLGARVYLGLSPLAFRRLVLSLLSAAGVLMVVASLPRVIGPMLQASLPEFESISPPTPHVRRTLTPA